MYIQSTKNDRKDSFLIAQVIRFCSLDQIFPEFASCFTNVFGRTAIEVLQAYPDPEELAYCDLEELSEVIVKASRGRFGFEKARELKDRAANTFGIRYAREAFVLQLTKAHATASIANAILAAFTIMRF